MKFAELKKLDDEQLGKLNRIEFSDTKLSSIEIDYLIKIIPKLHAVDMINLKHKQIKGKDFSRLITTLPRCPSLVYLFLNQNKIDNENFKSLIDVLPEFKSLITIDLSQNKLEQLSVDDLNALVQQIKRTPCLTSLNLMQSDNTTIQKTQAEQIKIALDANKALCKEVIWAAQTGDLEKLESTFARNASVNSAMILEDSDQFETALHIAAKEGHIEIVQHLLQKRVNKNIRDPLGKTPLMRATDSLASCLDSFERTDRTESEKDRIQIKIQQLREVIALLEAPLLAMKEGTTDIFATSSSPKSFFRTQSAHKSKGKTSPEATSSTPIDIHRDKGLGN